MRWMYPAMMKVCGHSNEIPPELYAKVPIEIKLMAFDEGMVEIREIILALREAVKNAKRI